MATELPHIEAKDGDVWIDGVSYTPKEARAIWHEIAAAIVEANRWRYNQIGIIRAAADKLAHDSARDTRPSELAEGETEQ
jgi:hypothetical protein